MKVKAIISALMLMACGMASAQTKTYLNVETAPGVYKSFEVNKDLKISWGEKKEVPPTTGTAKRTGDVDVKWVQLWKDGPKFAEYNIGAANNKAEDYGGYYCWGSIIDKDKNGAYKEGTTYLTGDDDTATALWGKNWRMPTGNELLALLSNCDVEVIKDPNDDDKILGAKFTGTGAYSSNSIYLPAAGCCEYGSVEEYPGHFGNYWSGMQFGNDRGYCLEFNLNSQKVVANKRDFGCSVRAVLNETK